jgi:3-oxoacyl-(acyl-carrier-protein) synthase
MNDKKKNRNKRIAITGLGIVTPTGIGKEEHWHYLQKGFPPKNNLHQVKKEFFPYQSGSLIQNFNIRNYCEDQKLMKLLHPVNQFAFAAASLAIEDSGINGSIEGDRKGLFFINSLEQINEKELERAVLASEEEGRFSYDLLGEKGLKRINPITPVKSLPNSALSIISIHFNFHGHNCVGSPFESEAGMLLHEAAQSIRDDVSDYCLVGAADAPFCVSIAGDLISRDSCKNPDQDDIVIRNLHLSEGAVFIALENEEKVREENRRVYGYIDDCFCQGPGATDPVYTLLHESYREVVQRQMEKRPVQTAIPSNNGLPLVKMVERDFWDRDQYKDIRLVSFKKTTGYFLSSSFLLDICHACLLLHHQTLDPVNRIKGNAVVVAGISLSLDCVSAMVYRE